MQGPAIYHGASNGNGPWPSGGGASAVFFDAGQLVPYQDHLSANPPRLVNNEMWFASGGGFPWYARAMAFENPVLGASRSFASFVFSVPLNFDPAFPISFRVAWTQNVIGLAFLPLNWSMQIMNARDLGAFSPSGAWTSLTDVIDFTVGCFQWSPLVAVAPDGAYVPLLAGDLVCAFLGRAYDGADCDAYCFGVEASYRVLA